MKQLLSLILTAVAPMLLVACGKPAPIESVGSLVTNPERLKELRAQCRADHPKVGDEQCNAVAEATRRRFFAGGGPKHTPAPAASAPAAKD